MTSSLDERLDNLDSRLAVIEKYLNIPIAPKASAPHTATEPKISQQTSSAESGKWLGLIALICFVLAAGFIIKLTIDSGWLTPLRQVCIAALFGFTLILSGLKFINLDREYISLLPASGIIILFLSIFAAQRFYALISFEVALLLTGLISLLCIGLYLKIRHEIYPITASIGAYVGPILLEFNVNAEFTLYYFAICSVTFTILSILLRSRVLMMLSAYLAILFTASLDSNFSTELNINYAAVNHNGLIAAILAFHFLVFSFGTYCYSIIVKKSLTEHEAWGFFPVLLIFYVAEYHYVSLISPTKAPWLSLMFAAFLMVLYVAAKNIYFQGKIASQPMILAFVSIIAFHAGYIELIPSDQGQWLLVAILLGFAFLPARFVNKQTTFTLNWPIYFFLFLILSIEYAKMVSNLFLEYHAISWPVILLACVSIWFVFFRHKSLFEKDHSYGTALLIAAHFLVISAFYRFADPHGSLLVSLSWLIYAIAILSVSYLGRDKMLARSALLVLAFAAGKALLFDAASAPTIVRILCLISTGVVLYMSGLFFRKISHWKD